MANFAIPIEETCWEQSSLIKGFISKCGNSSVGRARPCQGRGREFESRFPLHTKRKRVTSSFGLSYPLFAFLRLFHINLGNVDTNGGNVDIPGWWNPI